MLKFSKNITFALKSKSKKAPLSPTSDFPRNTFLLLSFSNFFSPSSFRCTWPHNEPATTTTKQILSFRTGIFPLLLCLQYNKKILRLDHSIVVFCILVVSQLVSWFQSIQVLTTLAGFSLSKHIAFVPLLCRYIGVFSKWNSSNFFLPLVGVGLQKV